MSKVLVCFALVSLWLLSCPVVAVFLAQSLEQDVALEPTQLGAIKADAIVVLSAGHREFSPEYGEPVSDSTLLVRLRYGAYLQSETGLPVLLSGGKVWQGQPRSLAETMEYDFVESFKAKVTWLEGESRTTGENASYSYAILSAENKSKIVLVTSAIHMMRARWSFEEAGFEVIPAPTNFSDQGRLTIQSFMPSARGLELSSQAIHEWMGYCAYQVVGL